MSSLQRATDLHEKDLDAVPVYKETLIDYLERFIQDLVFATADIATKLDELAELGMERLLAVIARRDRADAIDPTEADYADSLYEWQVKWNGLRGWFIAEPGVSSQSEVLRAWARTAIPTLLNAIAGLHDRRTHRSDRAADLRALAAGLQRLTLMRKLTSCGGPHSAWRLRDISWWLKTMPGAIEVTRL